MARKDFLRLSDVRATVGASATGKMSVILPKNCRINNIGPKIVKNGALATVAQLRLAIGQISLVLTVNGRETIVSQFTAGEWFAILEANGYTLNAGLMKLFFAEPWRALVLDEEATSLEMRNYEAGRLDIDVTNDANPLGFVFDAKVGYDAKLDPVSGKPFKGLITRDRQTANVGGGAGVQIVLNKVAGQLQRLFIFTPSSVTLSRVVLKRGVTPSYDFSQTATEPGLADQLADNGMKIPSTFTTAEGTFNCWPLVLDNNQQLRDGEPNPNDLALYLDLSAASQVRIVREAYVAL